MLLAWVGLANAAEASAAVPSVHGPSYTYDAPNYFAVENYTAPGRGPPVAIHNPSSPAVRIMESTSQYPNGYVRIYNGGGQPMGLNGKPGPPSATHIPLRPDGTFPFPNGWGG